jgi:hypothetical protein
MTTDFLFLFPSPTEAHAPNSATVPHQGPCPEKMLPNTRPPPPPNEPSPLPGPTPYNEAVFTTVRAFSPRGLWGTPGGQSPPGTLGATSGDLDSCKDSESSY